MAANDEVTFCACGAPVPPRRIPGGVPKRFCSPRCCQRHWRIENADRVAAARMANEAKNKEAIRIRQAKWARENKDKKKAIQQRYTQRRRLEEIGITTWDREDFE